MRKELVTRPIEQRFSEKLLTHDDGCILWTGYALPNGYGIIGNGRRGSGYSYVHRLAWEIANGPIPAGLQIDHLCHRTLCCNTAHLRVVTPSENAQNKRGAKTGTSSGVRGVYWRRDCSKWQVQAVVGGRNYYGGLFDDLGEAESAAIALRKRIHAPVPAIS